MAPAVGTSLRHQRLSKRKKQRMGPMTAELVKIITSVGRCNAVMLKTSVA